MHAEIERVARDMDIEYRKRPGFYGSIAANFKGGRYVNLNVNYTQWPMEGSTESERRKKSG